MRALGVGLLVGLLGCGGARSGAGEREGEGEGEAVREEHHPPLREEPGEPPPALRPPELADPLAVGPKPAFSDVKQAWREGQLAYELGRYDDAIRAFSAGYELMSHPSFLFNIAQAHRLRGDPRRAIFFYRAYLRLEPESKQRDAIMRRIRALEDELEGRTAAPPPPVG